MVFSLVSSASSALAAATVDEVVKSMTQYYGQLVGHDIVIATKEPYPGSVTSYRFDPTSGVINDTGTKFRIGSQTKMFTTAVILDLMEHNKFGGFDLNSTINDLLENSAVKAILPENTGSRIGHYKIYELLNMTTDLPNYLAEVPPGENENLLTLWTESTSGGATGGYGTVDGFDDSDNYEIYKKMAELAMTSPPMATPTPPFTGAYSNSNAVVMALITTALTGTPFEDLLNSYLSSQGWNDTNILGAPDDTNGQLIGSDLGVNIAKLDARLAWTSGAIITTMDNLLSAVEIFKNYDNGIRLKPDNTIVLDMHGQPVIYGLGLFNVELPVTVTNEIIMATGHAGGIPGSASFSGWLSSEGNPTFDIGFSVYVNGTTFVTEAGYITAGSSDTIFVNMADQLYRQFRSANSGADFSTSKEVTYGTSNNLYGGYSTASLTTIASGETLSFATNAVPALLVSFNTDALTPGYGGSLGSHYNPFAITLDPVYSYYQVGSGAGIKAITFDSGSRLDMPDWARLESRGNGNSTNPFTFVSFGTGSTGDIVGEIAAYGTDIITVESARDINVTGAIEAHGHRAVALDIKSGASSGTTISGQISAVGSGVTALKVAAPAATVTQNGGVIWADSYAVALEQGTGSGFVPLSPDKVKQNGAVAVSVESGTFTSNGGTILARADHPTIDGTPALDSDHMGVLVTGIEIGKTSSSTVNLNNRTDVSSYGYGVDFLTQGGTLKATDSTISGNFYAIHIDKTAGQSDIVLVNSEVLGRVLSETTSGASPTLTADATSQFLSANIDDPVIKATGTPITITTSPGTKMGWVLSDYLPELGNDYTLVEGASASSNFNGLTMVLGANGLFELSTPVFSNGRLSVGVSGLGSSYGPNARAIYDAYRLQSQGKNPVLVIDALTDANNLSPESHLDQFVVGQQIFRQAFSQILTSILTAPFPTLVASNSSAPAAGSDSTASWVISTDYTHFTFDADNHKSYSGYNADGDQLTFGLGKNITPTLSLHGFIALGQSDTDFDHLKANIDSELLLAGAAIGYRNTISDDLGYRIMATLALGSITNEYHRSVGIALPQYHDGTFDQKYLNLDLDFTVDYRLGQATFLSPRLNFSYLRSDQDGLSEPTSTNNFTALTTESIRTDNLQTLVGVGLSHEFTVSQDRSISVGASTGWLHSFGDVNPVSRGSFTGATSGTFVTKMADNPRDSLAVEAKVELINTSGQGGLGLSLGYSGQLASRQALHQFHFGLNYSF
jgi:CubicO group peptidase (beta-lactamase class C family)